MEYLTCCVQLLHIGQCEGETRVADQEHSPHWGTFSRGDSPWHE